MRNDQRDEHNAKLEILRLDTFLATPVLLIGGLAVQRYVQERGSKDIDIVCDLDTQKRLLSEAYGPPNYEKNERQTDMRPVYEIKDHLTGVVVFLGSKIVERDPYPFIDYNVLLEASRPFFYDDKEAENIRIPEPHGLAFSKLISYISRRNTPKGLQDLEDFSKLTNHQAFSLNKLITLSQRLGAAEHIDRFFREHRLSEQELDLLGISSIMRLQSILPMEVLYTISERSEESTPVFAPIDTNFKFRSIEIEFRYLDVVRMRYTKTKRLTALKNNVGSFYDQFRWTGDEDLEFRCIDPNHLLHHRPPKSIWRRYEVDFQRILKEHDEEDVSLVWDVSNEEGKFVPFISVTIDNPTEVLELKLDVSAVQEHIGKVYVDTLPLLGGGTPLYSEEVEGSEGVYTFSCTRPRLLHTYEMRWIVLG